MTSDFSYSFLLNKSPIRGRLVRLHHSVNTIIQGHHYSDHVGHWLGQFIASTVGLASLMKFDGIFTLQTKTDGPLPMIVCDVNSDGHIRGYAQARTDTSSVPKELPQALGKGYMAFTIDQRDAKDRYQGIVELSAESLAQAIEHYFEQSEQLKTRCKIFCRKTESGWESAILILQQLPQEDCSNETWEHLDALLNTMCEDETLTVEPHILLHRIFHEFDESVLGVKEYIAKCRCSEKRILDFLHTMPEDDREDLLKDGPLEMRCEFCNHLYTFNRSDIMPVH